MQVSFPVGLKWVADRLQLVGQSQDAQQGVSGAFTVRPSLTGHWRASATFLLTNEATVLAWQGFVAQMEGQIGTTLFPIWQRYPARTSDGALPSRRAVAVIGDDLQDERAGSVTFEGFGLATDPVVLGSLSDAAALRAAQIRVIYGDCAGLRPGQVFSIGDRLYRVQLSWADGAETVLQIAPPLRAAAAAGAVLIMDAPVCRMRFASEDEGVVDFDRVPVEQVTVQMIEAL